jgi:hypothetical protein
MKRFCIALALCSGIAHAETQINVKNFNFSYQNPQGEGKATSFSRSLTTASESVSVAVEKFNNDFHIQVTGGEEHEFIFKNAPSFLTDAETMNLSELNLDLNEQLNLRVSSARFDSRSDSLKLDGLALSCQKLGIAENVMDQLISGCIQKMTFKSSKFSSQDTDALISSVLSESLATNLAGIGVNSVDLSTNNGKFDLSGEVKAQISGKVKSHGNLSYDAASGKLTIKISEVKFGFLNITNKVFDELKKQESDKLTVKAPYVYLTVK